MGMINPDSQIPTSQSRLPKNGGCRPEGGAALRMPAVRKAKQKPTFLGFHEELIFSFIAIFAQEGVI